MNNESNLAANIAKGVISGLVASFVMNVFQQNASKLLSGDQKSHGAQSQQDGSPDHGAGAYLAGKHADDPKDNAPERLANLVSVAATDQPLDKDDKHRGGTLFHYLFGATTGGIYAGLSQLAPVTGIGLGVPYGSAVWLVADEMVVPALGLSKASAEYPASIHAYALASHVVYGLTTDLVLRMLGGKVDGSEVSH